MKPYTLKQFIEYVHMVDCLNTTVPPSKVTFKKYDLDKKRIVKKRLVEVRQTDNGIPYEFVIQKKETKKIPNANTNEITKLIVDYIHYIYPKSKTFKRISSEGKYRVGIGYIPSSNKGMSDAEGMVNGKFLSLELKIGKDKQRDSQKARQIEVENDGGIYYLCKWIDFETFQTEIQNLIPIE
jgi:hypothetical protein